MSAIYKIVGSICITTYILGLVANLVDLNYTQKAVKLVFTLYFLMVILIPLKDVDFDIGEMIYEIQNVQTNSENYIISSTIQRIENDVKQALDKENISYSDVYVHIDKQSDGIYLDYIKICGANEGNYSDIRNVIGSQGKIIFGE